MSSLRNFYTPFKILLYFILCAYIYTFHGFHNASFKAALLACQAPLRAANIQV